MIRVSHLTKSFNDQLILSDINLNIEKGEIVVLLGESGAGKSVLLKHLIGLLQPNDGSIWINNKEITRLKENELLKIRKDIGYLFQEGALYDFMNVYENIAFPLREHTDLDEKTIREKVKNILDLVGLHDVEEKLPSQLSGGMKKRVALARSIIMDSKILFCDEPTSGLDPIRSRDICDLIKNISKRLGCTTVVTSHDIVNSMRMADRLILIRDAKVVAMGTPEEFRASTNNFVKEFIS